MNYDLFMDDSICQYLHITPKKKYYKKKKLYLYYCVY